MYLVSVYPMDRTFMLNLHVNHSAGLSWKILALIKRIFSFFQIFCSLCFARETKDLRKTFFNAENQAGYLTWPIFFHELYLVNPFVTSFLNPTYLRLTIKVARWKPKALSFIHYFLRAIWVQVLLIFASSTLFTSKICIK